jgi:hypothetical protein
VSIFERQVVLVEVAAMLFISVTIRKDVVAEDLKLLFTLQLDWAFE